MQAKLKAIIWQTGIPQSMLARELKMSVKTMSNKMTGKASFTWPEVKAVCRLFNIANPFDAFE